MKPKLELDTVVRAGWRLKDCYNYYFPYADDNAVDFWLWECTPYPFCDASKLLELMYDKYVGYCSALGIVAS